MLAHDGIIKSVWNIWILIFIIYTAIYQPYKIAFVEDEETWDAIVDSVMDISFIFDLILNFFTDYIDTETN